MGLYANCEHLININSLPMVVDIAPQTELATYTGLYYFASTSAAVIGPFIAGLLIDALGKDWGDEKWLQTDSFLEQRRYRFCSCDRNSRCVAQTLSPVCRRISRLVTGLALADVDC